MVRCKSLQGPHIPLFFSDTNSLLQSLPSLYPLTPSLSYTESPFPGLKVQFNLLAQSPVTSFLLLHLIMDFSGDTAQDLLMRQPFQHGVSSWPQVCHCSGGGGTWKNGAGKGNQVKSHELANFIQSVRQLLLGWLRRSQGYAHEGKLHVAHKAQVAETCFFHRGR